jgi:hypothetical protein
MACADCELPLRTATLSPWASLAAMPIGACTCNSTCSRLTHARNGRTRTEKLAGLHETLRDHA